jgi:hypothetical protein
VKKKKTGGPMDDFMLASLAVNLPSPVKLFAGFRSSAPAYSCVLAFVGFGTE